MGLLKTDNVLEWEDIQKIRQMLKQRGTAQFLTVYKSTRDYRVDFLWGDELEVMILSDPKSSCLLHNSRKVENDEESNRSNVNTSSIKNKNKKTEKRDEESNRSNVNSSIIENKHRSNHKKLKISCSCSPSRLLLCGEAALAHFSQTPDTILTPEFAGYMLETTPGHPHSSNLINMVDIEKCMKRRLCEIDALVGKYGGYVSLITCFGKIGIYDSFFHKNTSNDKNLLNINLKNNNIEQMKNDKNISHTNLNNKNIEQMNEDKNKLNSNPKLEDIMKHMSDRGYYLKNEITKSHIFPDNAITEHKRFYSFVRNIINRRGRKVEGYIRTMDTKDQSHPINIKNETPDKKYVDDSNKENHNNTPNTKSNNHQLNGIEDVTETMDDYVLIDSMGQGMGCSCLQVTLQPSTYEESTYVYDMMGSICPLLLRLTRATALCQGRLLNTETRWDMLSFSVDCRSDAERGSKFCRSGDYNEWDSFIINDNYLNNPAFKNYISKNNEYSINGDSIYVDLNKYLSIQKNMKNPLIPKSRFSSIDLYISNNLMNLDIYNDIYVPLNEETYKTLLNNDVDEKIARHVSSLFIRDPVLVYDNEYYNKALNKTDICEKTMVENEGLLENYTNNVENSNNIIVEHAKAVGLNDESSMYDLESPIKELKTEKAIVDVLKTGIIMGKIIEEQGEIINDNLEIHNNKDKSTGIPLNNVNANKDIDDNIVLNGTKNNNMICNNENVNTYKGIDNNIVLNGVNKHNKINNNHKEINNDSMKNEDGSINTEDFENLQSSNWRSMRFKLPSTNPKGNKNGWKVEVRPMEIQPTPFENAAWSIFTVLLSKAILKYKLNFYIPISMVDENFRRGNICYNKKNEYRNYKKNEKVDDHIENNNNCIMNSKKEDNYYVPKDKAMFFYRSNIYETGLPNIKIGTIEEIFMGDSESYKGILQIIKEYIKEESTDVENEKVEKIYKYIDFIENKVRGNYMSFTDWQRKMMINCKEGIQNGIVTEKCIDELIEKMRIIKEDNSVEYLRNIEKQ